MDLSKIFLKGACPTPIGGQAVMEGVMMRGDDRMAVAVRLPDGRIYLKTELNKKRGKISQLPLIRGVVAFVRSLALGTKIMTFSADVLEYFMPDEDDQSAGQAEGEGSGSPAESNQKTGGASEPEEKRGLGAKLEEKLDSKAGWNFMMALSVIIAIAVSVGVFILLPTVVVNFLSGIVKSGILLNLIEGVFRIVLFVAYIALISQMNDIKRVFQYHGAEHKTIHCFENGKELTPENAKEFYRLHPRCGTSFLMFVMVISLVLFSLLGWPTIEMRILSRIVLIPVVASLSFELLKWAGRSDNKLIEVLSIPGLLLQKLTTRDPDASQLEIAIVSLKAVLVDKDTPVFEGITDTDAGFVEPMTIDRDDK